MPATLELMLSDVRRPMDATRSQFDVYCCCCIARRHHDAQIPMTVIPRQQVQVQFLTGPGEPLFSSFWKKNPPEMKMKCQSVPFLVCMSVYMRGSNRGDGRNPLRGCA